MFCAAHAPLLPSAASRIGRTSHGRARIWGSPDATRVCFSCLLAEADRAAGLRGMGSGGDVATMVVTGIWACELFSFDRCGSVTCRRLLCGRPNGAGRLICFAFCRSPSRDWTGRRAFR